MIRLLSNTGGDLVSTGVVGAMCMSDWAIPLRGSHAFKRKQHRLPSSSRSSVESLTPLTRRTALPGSVILTGISSEKVLRHLGYHIWWLCPVEAMPQG